MGWCRRLPPFLNQMVDNVVCSRHYSTVRFNTEEEDLGGVFSALADPTRRALVARLAAGEATVNELAEPFPITLQAVSKHLKVLETAGLIARGRRAQQRPCRLRPDALARATDWLEVYRRLWEASFDRLAEHIGTTPKGSHDRP